MHALPLLATAALLAICAHALKLPARDRLPSAVSPSALSCAAPPAGATTLGIQGATFTLNGKTTFLLGISYYGALGASETTWKADLDRIQRYGFNWLRVWANWEAFGNDASAVDGEGRPREPYLGKLKALLSECDRRGMILDVTLTRGKSAAGMPRLLTYETHLRAVETLVQALKPRRNWYLDLANERNIRDPRYAPIADLKRLRDRVKQLDPELLVTASHGGDISREELEAYLQEAQLDFLCPHPPRQADSAKRIEAKTRELFAWMREKGRVAPIHYQEPFRRDYGDWQPRAQDFAADLNGARAGGAAGWCFHNGGNRKAKDGRPRRSFDLHDGPLFEQLDEEERKFVQKLPQSGKVEKE